MGEPSPTGRFGEFGGRFVPETLVPACQELEAAFREAGPTPRSGPISPTILRDYAGRPSILTECHQLGARLGLRLLLKREDLNHTGSHKINNVLGQALLAKRMGKTRLVAETGAGQHGVASATAAALLGLECKVYMGAVDVERQALNVFRMRLLGSEVEAVESGSRTLKDAVNEAMRDWVATVGDTHYCLGSVMGPHPYPWMVREFHRVIGDEAREQCRTLTGADPDVVVACVGGGSNAIGIFSGFADLSTRLVGVEPAGGAAVSRGVPGVVHGMRSYLMQDEYGQVEEAQSISAGLDYPGVGPEHAYLCVDRARRVPERHRCRGGRGVPIAVANGGDHPGPRERARPGVDGARSPLARRCGGPVEPLGAGRQGRRADDGHHLLMPRLEAEFRAKRDAGRQAPRAVHHRWLPGLAGRDPRRGRVRCRCGRDRCAVLRSGDGRARHPAGVTGRARRRRDASGDPRRGPAARRLDPADRDDVLQPRAPRRAPTVREPAGQSRCRRVHPARSAARGVGAVDAVPPTTRGSRRSCSRRRRRPTRGCR